MGLGAATAIQGGVNIASGVLGNLFQKRNIRLQEEANTRLADHAYSKDLEMWNLQNLYNQPKSQMQRYKEAGLNPNLIYGSGTSSAGNASASPKAQQVTSGLRKTTMPKLDMLGLYQNVRQTEANIKNTQSNTQHTDLTSIGQQSKNAISYMDAQLKDQVVQWSHGKNLEYWNKGIKRNNYQAMQNEKWIQAMKGTTKMNMDYQMSAKKQNLIDLNIELARQATLTKLREYKWMNVEKGAGLAGKAIGGAIGWSGVGKMSKIAKRSKLKSPYATGRYGGKAGARKPYTY